MYEKPPLPEVRPEIDILASEIKEQLTATRSSFIQSAVSTYDTMLADRGPDFMYGQDHLAEEFEAAHIGLFMIGVQEANPVVATNALRLMGHPTHKWQAAVWAVKQGHGSLFGLWQEELGAAQAVAKETSSKDAFDVGLAQLELELYSAKTALGGNILRSNVDSLILDLESNLKDINSFPGALNCDTAALFRLEIARMLCLYGDLRRARQLRDQSSGAYQSELDHFDAMLQRERASKLTILGLGARLLMRKTHAQLRSNAPRANLIPGMRKIYDYEWDVNPVGVVAAQGSRIDASVSSLDLFLRAGAYDSAVNVYEGLFANDERRGGNTQSHRGIQVQAAALMHAHRMQDRSAVTAAEITSWFDEIGMPALQAHATVAERGMRGTQEAEQWDGTLTVLATMSDIPERAGLLLRAAELLASRSAPDAGMLGLRTGRLLTRTCHAWLRQIPGDERLDSVMKSDNPAIARVRQDMDQFVRDIRQVGDLHTLFISSREVEALLRRTEK